MPGKTPTFLPHGSSRFERRGQILLLHSTGPFNYEHIVSLAPAFRAFAAQMAPNGPWVSLNLVSGSILTPPDAMAALTESARWSRDELGRVGMAYVAAPDIEGYRVMRPLILRASEQLLPTRFFERLDDAIAWGEQLIAEANTR